MSEQLEQLIIHGRPKIVRLRQLESLRARMTMTTTSLALRCRARAGFSRRSRENPVAKPHVAKPHVAKPHDVWFRPCIAGQLQA